MKILIITYYFFPEITPRAFRAFELAKEFSRLGHDVSIIIPSCNFNYKDLELEYNVKVIQVNHGFFIAKNKHNKLKLLANSSRKNYIALFIRKAIKKVFYGIYMSGYSFEYFFQVYKFLSSDKNKYNLALSIGLPMSPHFGLALARKFNEISADTCIADYGDPFSFNQNGTANFFHRAIERFIINQFEYITLPIENAKVAFEKFKVSEKIKIIPQGLDFSKTKISEYKNEKIHRFAYAGIFYKDTREPSILLNYLCEITDDFFFVLYTDIDDLGNMEFINPYINKLGSKLVIKDFVPREECIYELSKFDFLINQDWLNKIQSPSKLIDYTLTKRPVFSFNQNEFDEKRFDKFLSGDYPVDSFPSIDLSHYDIRIVASKFLSLCKV